MLRIAVLLVLGSMGAAQLPAQQFDVASVRANKSGVPRYGFSPQGNRFTATNVSLFALIQWAYEMEDFRISGAPAWMKSDHFDIAAESEGTPSIAQLRLMLQPLLADRFHLQLQRQTKELPVYELSVAKGGSKLKEGRCTGAPSPANPCGGTSGSTRGTLIGRAVSMQTMAKDLSGVLSRVVLDKTMLRGEYDFDLTWTPDETFSHGPGDPDAPAADSNGPSIFTALQEQLGLTLKPAKGLVDVLVIDRAEPPKEN
ncbi:MAG TPA: TIGR03435 family protein [Bryobacteraceae bacterium]